MDEIKNNDCIYGRNAVLELLAAGHNIEKLYIKKGEISGSLTKIFSLAKENHVVISEVDIKKLDYLSNNGNHQGVVAIVSPKEFTPLDDMIASAFEKSKYPFLIILDGIEDPGNIGAIIRSAEGAGVHGVILPKHRSAVVNSTVYKTSAGAIEHMALAKVTNITDTIKKLKKEGFWIFAAEAGGTYYYSMDYKSPTVLVLGSEGKGVSRIVKDNCDGIISIPMYGKVNSLNVSAAASVIMYEISRQQKFEK